MVKRKALCRNGIRDAVAPNNLDGYVLRSVVNTIVHRPYCLACSSRTCHGVERCCAIWTIGSAGLRVLADLGLHIGSLQKARHGMDGEWKQKEGKVDGIIRANEIPSRVPVSGPRAQVIQRTRKRKSGGE